MAPPIMDWAGPPGQTAPAKSGGRWRPAWAEVDLSAVRHNVQLLCKLTEPSSLCAVVKADGYGHGALPVARAALEAGAAAVAVAMVEEGVVLREAGITDPILLLSEPPPGSEEEVIALRLEPTVATPATLDRLAQAVAKDPHARLQVHVKVDTGMHRVGASPETVVPLMEQLAGQPDLVRAGLWTHLAVADGGSPEDRDFTAQQLERFEEVVGLLASRNLLPRMLHAANSAGALVHPASRYHMTRCGIAVYGHQPSAAVAEQVARTVPGAQLRPVLSLKARVSGVRRLGAGARPSYGRRRPLPEDALVATVPLGYADGLPRALLDGGMDVLLRGRRRPLAGVVTMDQIMIDCQDEADVIVGEEVVLLGRQGAGEITLEDWARTLGTIGYEVLTGFGPHVPRVVLTRPGSVASGDEGEDQGSEGANGATSGARGRVANLIRQARLK